MDFSPRPVSASPSPLQGRKVEKSKKSNISSKIDQFDLPARGRKVEKSKKFNIFKNIIVKSCIMYRITWRKNIRIQGYRICPLASRVTFKNVSAELFFFIWRVLQGYRICPLAPIFREKISGFIFFDMVCFTGLQDMSFGSYFSPCKSA